MTISGPSRAPARLPRAAGVSGRLNDAMDEPQPILRGGDALAAALRAVAAAPRATALFCDIDGTVSPIVSDPYAAVVPEPFRAALAALAPRLGLLAFVTGRDVRQAAAMVGLQGAAYVGLHGFDRMAPDGAVTRDPAAEPYVDAVQRMARRVRGLDAARLGLVVENKGPMLDLHYRQARRPRRHPGRARGRGARGRRATLAWRWRPATSWSSCARPWRSTRARRC